MRGNVVRFAVAVVLGLVGMPAVADAQQGRTLTAIGASSTDVTPTNAQDDASIKAAIDAARNAGIAPALAAARARAELMAQAAGVTLGGIHAIDESFTGSPYFHGGHGELGTFGPGKFCGTVPRWVIRRGPGRRVRRVRKGTRRICRYPHTIETRLAVTYAIQ